jgi:hypothetical protein
MGGGLPRDDDLERENIIGVGAIGSAVGGT